MTVDVAIEDRKVFVLKWGCIILGFALFLLAGFMIRQWSASEYVPRHFEPYRTPLAQIVPGNNFKPGFPSVQVPMDVFRRESACRPFTLAYPLDWHEGIRPEVSGKVNYFMLKQEAGIYLLAEERIPHYKDEGTIGYLEYTAFDRDRLRFYSVQNGRSSKHFFLALVVMLVGVLLIVVFGRLQAK